MGEGVNPNLTHPQYDDALPAWLRARDVLAGEDAVKAGGEKYLPRLEEQSEEEYAAYRARGAFFNATARTRDSLQGLVFRKPAEVRAPAAFVEDVDLAGTHAEDWCRWVLGEVVGLGRCGTLVDWCDGESRAYVGNYPAEAIINWRVERVGGRTVLTLLVLAETVWEDTAEEFAPVAVNQWRVLKLVAGGALRAEGTGAAAGERALVVEVWRRREEAPGARPVRFFHACAQARARR